MNEYQLAPVKNTTHKSILKIVTKPSTKVNEIMLLSNLSTFSWIIYYELTVKLEQILCKFKIENITMCVLIIFHASIILAYAQDIPLIY